VTNPKFKRWIELSLVWVFALGIAFGLLRFFLNSGGHEIVGSGHISVEAVRARYNAAAESFLSRTFPDAAFRDLITDATVGPPRNSITVYILLSKLGCSPCQLRELRNLDTLQRRLHDWKSIVAVLINSPRNEGLALRKVTRSSFAFWYSSDTSVANFNNLDRYPLILVVENRRVKRALIPVPSDDEHSLLFYEQLYSLLNKERQLKR
jgi:hypothetical protein